MRKHTTVKKIQQGLTKRKKKRIREMTANKNRANGVDLDVLSAIRHRGAEAQADLAVIRARAALVESRTGLINCARGLVKPPGERLRKCDADQVEEALAAPLSEQAKVVIGPLLASVEAISEQIRGYEEKIEEIAKRYPEMVLLKQVYGVGTVIALTYLVTLEDAERCL